MFFLLTAVTLAMAILLVRGRICAAGLALVTIVAIAITLETFRKAGMVLTLASTAAGRRSPHWCCGRGCCWLRWRRRSSQD
jgi:hypothetical protein